MFCAAAMASIIRLNFPLPSCETVTSAVWERAAAALG
ncbi:unnamed protein product [Prunus brigantina]